VFAGGCLVVQPAERARGADLPGRLARDKRLGNWPLVVLVDDAEVAARSPINFLWSTFTRFEPAADLHTASDRLVRHHRVFQAPVVIDARHKPDYPEELLCDEATSKLVTRRWNEYFPHGQEMGSSDWAHLD
jgi:hypothetical protein